MNDAAKPTLFPASSAKEQIAISSIAPQVAMDKRQSFLLVLGLAVVTLGLYWPATHYAFTIFDDAQYVYENPRVCGGLSWAGLKWAFGSTYAANWHPVTWLSHMLDWSLFGEFAGGHHLTNVLLHTANTVLLFLLLHRLTRRSWPSALVAALFAWHPLHVESVAWVAERKDVLSMFFFLLTLGTYARYVEIQCPSCRVQVPESGNQGAETKVRSLEEKGQGSEPDLVNGKSGGGWFLYGLALVLFAFGLMSKPMLVTLPFVLLLLDYWPLRRFELARSRLPWGIVLEKVPFFVLSVLASVATLCAQRAGGALKTIDQVPGVMRAFNAAAAYGCYLVQTICPVNLCVLYPLPADPPVGAGIISALALVGLSWWVMRRRLAYPWVLVGWFWFVGTLVPVIGLVQVGSQARADRYTYVPLIGLFLAVVWSIDYCLASRRRRQAEAAMLSVAAALACLVWTHTQLGYWRDSVTLFTRAVAVTRNNPTAHGNLGAALDNAGRAAEAMDHYQETLRLKPNASKTHYNIGVHLAAAGKLDEAFHHFSEGLKIDPRNAELHNNLGVIHAQRGNFEAALEEFEKAKQLNPDYPKPYHNCGMAWQKLGRAPEAVRNYRKALELDPAWPLALDSLAALLATCPDLQWRDPAAAVQFAQRATKLTRGESPEFLATLALAYAAAGQSSNSVVTSQLAREKAEQMGLAELARKMAQDLECYQAGRSPSVDWKNPAER